MTAPLTSVWVIELFSARDNISWTSVHKTRAGAQQELQTKAAQYGLNLSAIDDGTDLSGATYSCSLLPIQN